MYKLLVLASTRNSLAVIKFSMSNGQSEVGYYGYLLITTRCSTGVYMISNNDLCWLDVIYDILII